MIDRAEAERRVAAELARTGDGPDVVVVPERTIERPGGWIVFIDSERHLETGEHARMLVGNAPFLVSRRFGSVHRGSCARSIEQHVDDLDRFVAEGLDPPPPRQAPPPREEEVAEAVARVAELRRRGPPGASPRRARDEEASRPPPPPRWRPAPGRASRPSATLRLCVVLLLVLVVGWLVHRAVEDRGRARTGPERLSDR